MLERENLGPARDAIHDMFLEHVMAHAPGYDRLISWTDAPIMPTPGAVGVYMDRQEAELRAELEGTGVSVTRIGDNITLNMPGNVTSYNFV